MMMSDRTPAPLTESDDAAAGAPARKSVLVIEGPGPLLSCLRIMLTSLDYRVIVATTADEGLRLATEARPDVILLSLNLPEAPPGTSLIIRLRDRSSVPVVLLAARGQQQQVVANLEAGAQDYLVKPFEVETLDKRLRTTMKHGAAADAALR